MSAPTPGGEPPAHPVLSDRDAAVSDLFVVHHRRLVGLAFANHDADGVAALLSPGVKAWPSLRLEVPRNEAWQVEYDAKACEARTVTSIGIMSGATPTST